VTAASPKQTVLRARYAFPVDRPPIADAAVVIEGQHIAAVDRWPAGRIAAGEVIDLGNAALLPGLVNAHTHLEFSDLPHPLGSPGMAFPDWIRQVIAHRRQSPADRTAAVAAGLSQSLRAGVTTLGEIATAPWSAAPFDASPIAATVFLEVLGLRSELIEERVALAQEHLEPAPAADQHTADQHPGCSAAAGVLTRWRAGISPHAPYSVHPELFVRCVGLARQARAPLAFHLAESREELQLLRDGTGPFRELLIELEAWDETAIPRGTRPLEYLQRLADAPRALVVHGNYLAEDEIGVLAAHAAHMSLVCCPRTHAYFGHEPYPLAQLLAAGVTVSLGTDSRASNPDLSLLAEMRHIARASGSHDGDVPLDAVLRFGTLAGAQALGRADAVGTLTVGKHADLCAVQLPNRDTADPHEMLLLGNEPVVATWTRGKLAFAADNVRGRLLADRNA
jgi:cytosine/adenosine deaminase-related metal-dependent hydrolase